MKIRVLLAAGVASAALLMSATSSYAFLGFEAGETLGVAFAAPLPEGLFAVDLQSYGRRDVDANHDYQTIVGPVPGGGGNATAGPAPNVAINIPDIVWSTPFSFYNTRLEILYSAPVVTTDSRNALIPSQLTNRTDVFNQSFGPILAHNFGNGFNAAVSAWVRPPAAFSGFVNHTYADLRGSVSYVANGWNATAVFGYTGTFGGHEGGLAPQGSTALSPLVGTSDAVDVDFTLSKHFGKFELGFVGYYFTDINVRGDNSTVLLNGSVVGLKERALAVGGLVGYDFGRFTLQAYAVRDVYSKNQEIIPFVGGFSNPETRGFLRLVLPLYVAPAPHAPLLQARY